MILGRAKNLKFHVLVIESILVETFSKDSRSDSVGVDHEEGKEIHMHVLYHSPHVTDRSHRAFSLPKPVSVFSVSFLKSIWSYAEVGK